MTNDLQEEEQENSRSLLQELEEFLNVLVEFEGLIWELCAAEDVPHHDGVVHHLPPDHLWLSTGR